MKCLKCGFENPAGFKFCGSCGEKLAPLCPSCGQEVPEGFKFCGNCGASLASTAPVPPPPAPRSEQETPEERPLTSERRQVTVLFGDVSGFTAMSEKLDPEEVRLIMDACLKRLAREIEELEGTVDKFSGDSIMAVFGAPVAHEDDAERSVLAAIRMQEALGEFSAQLHRKTGLTLSMRMGINTGIAMAGMVGSMRDKDYTVMGDTVNVAARLQQAAPVGKILVGEKTFKATKAIIEYKSLPDISVKGKSVPVPIWEVRGLKSQPESKRGIPGLRAPMIGRESDMSNLKTAFETVMHNRRPLLVTIFGPPGIGKSRLVLEFQGYLDELPTQTACASGQCLPYGEQLTFWPLKEMLESTCGIMKTDSLETARLKLRGVVEEILTHGQTVAVKEMEKPDRGDLPQICQRIGLAIGIETEEQVTDLDPKSLRDELFWGLRKFFEGKATDAPLTLVFDNIHWAEPSMLDFIEYLHRTANGPLFILCLARPDLMERRPTWGAYKKGFLPIFLEPLDDGKSSDLLTALLTAENLPRSLKEKIVEKSEGNPFYVEETLRMLIDDGSIVKEKAGWRTAKEMEDVNIPDTVQGIIAARLDRLTEEEKGIINEAAIVGREFWLGSLMSLVKDMRKERIYDHLQELERKELLKEKRSSVFAGDKEFAFYHILTREVAYEALPKAKRSPKHRAVAEWLEKVAGERLEEFVELLAYHWDTAVSLSQLSTFMSGTEKDEIQLVQRKAMEYLKRTGDKAKRRYLNIEAEGAYRRAISIWDSASGGSTMEGVSGLHPSHLSLLCDHAEVLERLGKYEKTIGELATVREEAQSTANQDLLSRALLQLGRVYRAQGELSQAQELGVKVLNLSQELNDKHREGQTLLLLGKISYDRADLQQAENWAQLALGMSRVIEDKHLEMSALPLLGNIYLQQGELSKARSCYLNTLSLARTTGDKGLETLNLYLLGTVKLHQTEFDEAEKHLNDALILADEMGNRRVETWCYLARSLAHTKKQQWEESETLARKALDLCHQLGDRWAESWCLKAIGDAHKSMGQFKASRDRYEAALSLALKTGDKGILPEIYGGLAETYLGEKDPGKALEYAREAQQVVAKQDVYSQGTAWRILGKAYVASGDLSEAEKCFEKSIEVLRTTGFKHELAESLEELNALPYRNEAK